MSRQQGRPVVESSQAASSAFHRATRSVPVCTHTLDVTAHRRRVAIAMLRDKAARPEWAVLSYEAKLLFVVGLIICDEAGFIAERDLIHACTRPAVLMLAESLLTEAGADGR